MYVYLSVDNFDPLPEIIVIKFYPTLDHFDSSIQIFFEE